MKRICVLGNSHLAAVKLGWDQRPAAHDAARMDFFGTPGDGLADVAIEAGRLVAQTPKVQAAFAMTSGGMEAVTLADYDAFVIVALRYSMASLVRTIYARYRSEEHNNLDGDVTMVSDATFLATARRKLERSRAVELANQLRGVVSAPILIVPQLLVSEAILQATDDALDAPLWQAAVRAGDDVALDETLTRITAALGDDRVGFLPQPAQTRAGHIFTRREFGVGSVRLRVCLRSSLWIA